MRTNLQLALVLFAAAGCSRSPQQPLATSPHGYASRMEVADAHDRVAEADRRAVAAPDQRGAPGGTGNYQCGDVDMSDQLTSGGERLVPVVPCWDPVEEIAQRHRVARDEHQVRTERRAATKLVEAEIAACRGISPAEIEHSPFAHRKEIEDVIPHYGGGVIRGVRIVFKPVLGLSSAWMQRAISCHRARFERLGEPPTYLSDDPTLVPGATVTVSEHGGRIEVLVESRNDVSAHVALARAQDLQPRTAGR